MRRLPLSPDKWYADTQHDQHEHCDEDDPKVCNTALTKPRHRTNAAGPHHPDIPGTRFYRSKDPTPPFEKPVAAFVIELTENRNWYWKIA
jgi:hypothetical protein